MHWKHINNIFRRQNKVVKLNRQYLELYQKNITTSYFESFLTEIVETKKNIRAFSICNLLNTLLSLTRIIIVHHMNEYSFTYNDPNLTPLLYRSLYKILNYYLFNELNFLLIFYTI